MEKAIHDTAGALTGNGSSPADPERYCRSWSNDENERPSVNKADWILLTGMCLFLFFTVVFVLKYCNKRGRFRFLTAHVLTALLGAGYKVKFSVRTQAKVAEIRRLRPLQVDQLDFVVVEDVSVKEAIDEAVKGVSGVRFSFRLFSASIVTSFALKILICAYGRSTPPPPFFSTAEKTIGPVYWIGPSTVQSGS